MTSRIPQQRPTAPGPRRLPEWTARIPGPSDQFPSEMQQFLDWLRIQKNRPLTTVRAYRQDLAKFVAFTGISDRYGFCSPINREMLRRYQVELADLLPHARTRARALVALRQFLSYAYDEGWLEAELSRQVTVPRYTASDPHPIRTELISGLLAALPKENLRDFRDRALVQFLITTGCRISEACGTNRSDVRPEGFRVLGKGSKYRTVYMTEDAWEAVQDYLRVRGPDPSDALFISVARPDMPKGRVIAANRLTTDGARSALAALKRRMSEDPDVAGLVEGLSSPHAARHTAATALLEATDGDVRLVQEILGHATLETLKVYTEITDRRKREAYQRLAVHLHRA